MFKSKLSNFIDGAAVKTLSRVDATKKSNQHEIGTTAQMRSEFLGAYRSKFKVLYIWMDDSDSAITAEGFGTHYDTREKQPKRSAEWRLYYDTNPVTELMEEGDTVFIAKIRDADELIIIVTPPQSTHENQFLWLFGLQRPKDRFQSQKFGIGSEGELGFAGRFLLDELGVEYPEIQSDDIDRIVEKFGVEFPTTAVFSKLARETCSNVDLLGDPDGTLLKWLEHEEILFRRLEKNALTTRLRQGFESEGSPDVDGFLKFSLSVQNRRKSRMGHSFEHHLAAIFTAHNLRFERGKITENKQKPDFIFPSLKDYIDCPPQSPHVCMLAAKSTCKDRWRQILAEANKIKVKHLTTIEPSITIAQTDQMNANQVQLVVPSAIQLSYTKAQRRDIWSIADFIDFRKSVSNHC